MQCVCHNSGPFTLKFGCQYTLNKIFECNTTLMSLEYGLNKALTSELNFLTVTHDTGTHHVATIFLIHIIPHFSFPKITNIQVCNSTRETQGTGKSQASRNYRTAQ